MIGKLELTDADEFDQKCARSFLLGAHSSVCKLQTVTQILCTFIDNRISFKSVNEIISFKTYKTVLKNHVQLTIHDYVKLTNIIVQNVKSVQTRASQVVSGSKAHISVGSP